MRVVHIVKTLAEVYGGPARSVQGLVAGLEANGIEAWLVTFDESPEPWVKGVTHYCSIKGNVKANMLKLIDEIKPDLIQTHDLWMPKLHLCAVAARARGIPYIITPRGSLEIWSLKQKWWKKYPALWTYQGYDLRHALAIHTTADSEREQVQKFCGETPTFFSTNGVNLPETLPEWNRHADGFRRAVFISRIHKKKGLINLVHAWVQTRPKGWKMEIVGTNADGYQEVIEKEVKSCGIEADFIFTGPLADGKKWDAYRRADLFILPTHSENFGIVVAEALYAGLPVITTKGAPWADLESTKSGWWVEVGVEPLARALREATLCSDEFRCEMGERGHKLIADHYSWRGIAAGLKNIYRDLLANK